MEKMSKDTTQNRMQSRRAASKEALKHMQHIFNDERQDSSSDDDVVEVDPQPPPKKKLKLSNPKPTDGSVTLEKTLVLSKAKSVDQDVILLETSNSTTRNFESVFDLDFEIEELSESQKKRRDLMNREDQEVGSKLEEIMRLPHSEIIYNGVCTTALEINEQLANVMSAVQHAIPNQGLVLQAPGVSTGTTLPQSYQLVMDARSGVIVGAVTTPNAATSAPPLLYQTKVVPTTAANAANLTPEQSAQKGRRTTTVLRQVPASAVPQIKNMASQAQSKLTALSKQTPPPLVPTKQPQIQVKTNLGKQVASKFAKAYSPALKKIQASNLLPKTAPLLKPTENSVEGGLTTGRKTTKSVVDLTNDEGRPAPDSREISFNKLQGRTYPSLVVVARPHLRVKDLSSDRVALDAKVKGVLMFPPTKFTEWLIQQGLVRSDQKCSVHTANPLKLGMYSDATKFPYSGGYVWISECCPQRFVSVFSGSLFEGSPHPPMTILKLIYHWSCQTIVQNVTQWVKVDNLYVKGMYTCLRGICTVALHTHLPGLGGPGVRVQVGVISLGTTSQDGNQRQVKVEVLGIMETATKHIRLRAVEPLPDGERNYKKRFQKILEPVFNWVHPQSIIVTDLTVDKPTLHNMGFLHVSQNTSTDYSNSNRTIMEYLRRIVPRMFQNTLSLLSRQIIQQFLDELVWREWYGTTVASCFNTMLQHVSEQTRVVGGQPLIAKLTKVGANPFRNWSISVPNPPKVVEITQAPKRYQRVANKKVVPVPVVAPPPPPPPELAIVRPAKSTSPDVPKQLVPLENYYYGTMNVFTGQSFKMVLNIKCSICRMTFSNNIHLMNHLFRHAHNVSTDVQLCRYCLTIVPTADDLQKHVASSHPEETKSQNDFVCLICETHFMNPFVLGKHMSKEHCPSELPYMCGTCSFRCSNHKQAVDHFYQQHDNGSTIQCPFCLKSTAVNSGGRNIIQNLNYFIQHLQKHQKKQMAKKCGRCNLWFIQKEILKDHQLKMHMSQRGKHGLYRCLAPRNGVMVPKSQSDKSPNDAIVIDFSTLNFNINKKLLCKECEQPLASSKHFTAFQSCQNPNCLYSTCCSAAMEEHVTNCKNLKTKIPLEKLPFEMFCVCGYRVVFGNLMAKHLAICERKSAYPSGHAAKAATSTHSMLDVLGLVRRPEENPREKAAPKSRMATRLENDDDDAVVKEENELPPLKEEEIGEDKSPSSEVEKGSEVTPVEKEQLSDEKESETATDEKKSDDPLSERETESLSTEKKNDESSTEEENDESAQAIEKKDEEPLEESLAEKEGESEAQSNKEKNIIEESRPETEEVEPMDVSGPSKEKSSSETETPMDVVDAEEEKSDGAV